MNGSEPTERMPCLFHPAHCVRDETRVLAGDSVLMPYQLHTKATQVSCRSCVAISQMSSIALQDFTTEGTELGKASSFHNNK